MIWRVLREIDDRLLSPQPILLVAVEKILLSASRGLVAGALVFPLAWWILGSGYQVSTEHLAILVGLMALESLVGAALGLLLATVAADSPAAAGVCVGAHATGLYRLRLLSVVVAERVQVVPGTHALQSADLRL